MGLTTLTLPVPITDNWASYDQYNDYILVFKFLMKSTNMTDLKSVLVLNIKLMMLYLSYFPIVVFFNKYV